MYAALLLIVFTTEACVEDGAEELFVNLDAPEDFVADGEAYEIPGVGLIQYGGGVRTLATVTFPGGGAVQFHASESEDGHGCAGFFPANSAGEPALATAENGGCLSTFLALTPPETPVPAALLMGPEGHIDTRDRPIVDTVDEPIKAVELPLIAEVRPATDEGDVDDFDHACTGVPASISHWESVHCDEGGADHCDPGWTDEITISSTDTYYGSYQTGLFCGASLTSSGHSYWNGTSWVSTFGWVNASGVPSNQYVAFSQYWHGTAPWRRRVHSLMESGQFHHYTKMCTSVSCPFNG